MSKRRSCRRSSEEARQHDTAVKVRKMTDEQLCAFVDRTAPAFALGRFFDRLGELVGSGNGIGAGTVAKLRKIALQEGYTDEV